jgi:hypothetical protein
MFHTESLKLEKNQARVLINLEIFSFNNETANEINWDMRELNFCLVNVNKLFLHNFNISQKDVFKAEESEEESLVVNQQYLNPNLITGGKLKNDILGQKRKPEPDQNLTTPNKKAKLNNDDLSLNESAISKNKAKIITKAKNRELKFTQQRNNVIKKLKKLSEVNVKESELIKPASDIIINSFETILNKNHSKDFLEKNKNVVALCNTIYTDIMMNILKLVNIKTTKNSGGNKSSSKIDYRHLTVDNHKDIAERINGLTTQQLHQLRDILPKQDNEDNITIKLNELPINSRKILIKYLNDCHEKNKKNETHISWRAEQEKVN